MVRSLDSERLHQLAGRVGEHFLGVGFDGGDDLGRHRLGADLLGVDAGGHVGVDEPGVHGDDEGPLAAELHAERRW